MSYAFVHTHGRYKTKNEPPCKLSTLSNYDVVSSFVSNVPLWRRGWGGMLIMEEGMGVWGQGVIGGFLYLPLNLALNLKLL